MSDEPLTPVLFREMVRFALKRNPNLTAEVLSKRDEMWKSSQSEEGERKVEDGWYARVLALLCCAGEGSPVSAAWRCLATQT